MRRTQHLLAIFLAAVLLLPSCSEKLANRTDLSDADLYARGRRYADRKKFDDAIEHFQALLERFPTSPLAPGAQLALADARMENRDFVEAEIAFDDFLRLYPASDNVPYALFRKGELVFRQMGKPGRDQTKTVEALNTFSLLREKYPSSPQASAAANRLREIRNRLAEHEVYVVSHYLSRGKYGSAETRAKRALADYPDAASAPTLLSLLAEALQREGKAEDAAEARRSLQEKFPGRKPR